MTVVTHESISKIRPKSETMSMSMMRRCRAVIGMVLAVAAIGVVAVAPAQAEFGLDGPLTVELHDPQDLGILEAIRPGDGPPLVANTQAGGHPDLTVGFKIKQIVNPDCCATGLYPAGALKDVVTDLPAGFYGNPQNRPSCTTSEFTLGDGYCNPNVQVGVASIQIGNQEDQGALYKQPIPIYNIKAAGDQTAVLAFSTTGVPTLIRITPRTDGDYGLQATISGTTEFAPIYAVRLTLWGNPSDPIHDRLRRGAGGDIGYDPNTDQFLGHPATISPALPFLTAPARCDGPLTTSMRINSWQNPDKVLTYSATTPARTGCDQLRFRPSVAVAPASHVAVQPSGYTFDVTVPQTNALDQLSTPNVKDVTVALPAGTAISPSSADGLAACSDAQLGLHSKAVEQCPDASKIGTVTIDTPLLKDPLLGSVYVGTQESDDPQSGKMFRLFLVAYGTGVRLKLEGAVKVDPATGQITASFANNPQLPFSRLRVALKDGSRAPLANPAACGSQTVAASLSSWAGNAADLRSAFDIDCTAGLGAFAPAFTAGSTNAAAGSLSPFNVGLTKPDANADVTGLRMELPTGLLARLKGNLGRQVGTVKAFAGTGSTPFVLPGQVYLEGQYGDAPFSLRVVVPAKAGPFDLGEVVVRQKIYVDPIDAHVTVVSDPIPTIVKGVPTRLQRLDVSVDKAGFMVNPTSCDPKTIGGTLSSAAGQSVPIGVRFQVGDCASLDLKPQLALSLSGKGQTTDGKHPAVTATLTQPEGQANLKKVRVALPLSLALDPDNANGLCEFVDGSKVTPTCPAASIVGTATAVTPILDEPLTGPVYFVKNVRKDAKSGRDIKTLPKLVVPLTGQNGVKLTLTGTSDVVDDQLVTTFDNIPDASVASFKLDINGGKGGILAVSGADICKSTQIAGQEIVGQNNKAADADVFIQTPACQLKVLSKKVGKRSVTVKVGGLSAGKVTVTGKGIKKTTKTISKSTVVTITAKRTKGTPGKVTVSFDPAGPAKARKTTK